jgi:cellobiose-specific phosphotransferase system component IIC
MADAASRPFAVGAIAVPLVLPVLGYLSSNVQLMFTIHLFLGAFWFGTGVLGAVVLGPVMGSLSDEAIVEFAEGSS